MRILGESKKIIKTDLFPAFADKMRMLKDTTVSESYLKEYFKGSALKVDSMKAKADLYLIDFNRKPFKNNVLAIVSLGFYTRKKAKETLEKVREEKKRLEEEMARMDSEITRLNAIKDSLKLIADYYFSVIELYRALLVRLDNSVNFLMIRCICFAHKVIHEKMSIKLLPKSQQNEIMAIVSISKIMKYMVDKQITIDGKTETIKSLNLLNEDFYIQKKEIDKYNNVA